MDDLKMLELMDLIDPEYVQEASEPLRKGGLSKNNVRWWYYAGMAAGLVMSVISGGLLIAGGFYDGGTDMDNYGYIGTMLSENGNLILDLLMLSLVVSGVFLYNIIRKKLEGREK